MFYDNPKLWPAMIYGLFFVAGWTITQSGAIGAWYVFGNGLALVGGALAAITIMIYGSHWVTYFIDVIMASLTRTKASTLSHEMHGLTQEQTSVVRSQGEISLGLRLTARGPRMYVHGTMVPLDFVRYEFLPHCSIDTDGTTSLASINSWSDGKTWKDYGACRTLAKEFIQHLVSNGLAVWGAGNQSAKLVGDLGSFELLKMLGLVDRSATMSDIGSTPEEVESIEA